MTKLLREQKGEKEYIESIYINKKEKIVYLAWNKKIE